jgi:hypothetical protein
LFLVLEIFGSKCGLSRGPAGETSRVWLLSILLESGPQGKSNFLIRETKVLNEEIKLSIRKIKSFDALGRN